MAKKAKKRGFIKYKSYLFVDKDPIIDAFRTAMSDAHMTASDVSQASGVAPGMIRNWVAGNVRRPQFATVAAAIRATGKNAIKFDGNGRPFLVD